MGPGSPMDGSKFFGDKLDRFGITVEVCNIPLMQPRKRDKWMMMELKGKGHSTEDLRRLNRVWVHQQVLFLSDVLGASGKSLDKKYLKQRGEGEQWSTFRFPKEKTQARTFGYDSRQLHS